MNALELKSLKNSALSHIARTLYVFYMRPKAEIGENTLDLMEISKLLSSDSKFFPSQINLDVVKLCLTELEDLGFIKRRIANAPWVSAIIDFPLVDKELLDLPKKPFCLDKDWHPGPSFKDAALMVGLSDVNYTTKDLKAFVSFWSSKQEMRNQIAWERAFAMRLLRQKSARGSESSLNKIALAPNLVAQSAKIVAESGSLSTAPTAINSTIIPKAQSVPANPVAKTSQSYDDENQYVEGDFF